MRVQVAGPGLAIQCRAPLIVFPRPFPRPRQHPRRTVLVPCPEFFKTSPQPPRIQLRDRERSQAALETTRPARKPPSRATHGLRHRRIHNLHQPVVSVYPVPHNGSILGGVTRRDFLASSFLAPAALAAAPRIWPLGINTYCLRFQRWNDRQLFDYCHKQKLDAIFLQDSLDPAVMDPKHWADLRSWTKEFNLHIETGGGAILPKTPDAFPKSVATLRKNIERAAAVGSPIVRALLASDRYSMPDDGPVERHMETAIRILREVRSQALDAGLKIGIENHKELQAWETRQVIETAGKEFVGSYLDTGNPVFVAEHPLTTLEELGPLAVTFHLRDSVVYRHPDGIAIQWVPLGEGTVDFKALVAKAATIIPSSVYIYCKPITARPPVVLPIYSEEFWNKWFPRARSKDLGRFLDLARHGKPYDKPHILADLPEVRDRYMDALKIQQLDHMQRSLDYCRNALHLGKS